MGKNYTKLTLNKKKNEVEVAILISEKVDFKAKSNKGHYVMKRGNSPKGHTNAKCLCL